MLEERLPTETRRREITPPVTAFSLNLLGLSHMEGGLDKMNQAIAPEFTGGETYRLERRTVDGQERVVGVWTIPGAASSEIDFARAIADDFSSSGRLKEDYSYHLQVVYDALVEGLNEMYGQLQDGQPIDRTRFNYYSSALDAFFRIGEVTQDQDLLTRRDDNAESLNKIRREILREVPLEGVPGGDLASLQTQLDLEKALRQQWEDSARGYEEESARLQRELLQLELEGRPQDKREKARLSEELVRLRAQGKDVVRLERQLADALSDLGRTRQERDSRVSEEDFRRVVDANKELRQQVTTLTGQLEALKAGQSQEVSSDAQKQGQHLVVDIVSKLLGGEIKLKPGEKLSEVLGAGITGQLAPDDLAILDRIAGTVKDMGRDIQLYLAAIIAGEPSLAPIAAQPELQRLLDSKVAEGRALREPEFQELRRKNEELTSALSQAQRSLEASQGEAAGSKLRASQLERDLGTARGDLATLIGESTGILEQRDQAQRDLEKAKQEKTALADQIRELERQLKERVAVSPAALAELQRQLADIKAHGRREDRETIEMLRRQLEEADQKNRELEKRAGIRKDERATQIEKLVDSPLTTLMARQLGRSVQEIRTNFTALLQEMQPLSLRSVAVDLPPIRSMLMNGQIPEFGSPGYKMFIRKIIDILSGRHPTTPVHVFTSLWEIFSSGDEPNVNELSRTFLDYILEK